MAKKAKAAVTVDSMVFDEACYLLDKKGYLFDRDQAMAEIVFADGEIDDWQNKLNYMDAEAMADWLEDWIGLTDEANEAFTTAEMADAE